MLKKYFFFLLFFHKPWINSCSVQTSGILCLQHNARVRTNRSFPSAVGSSCQQINLKIRKGVCLRASNRRKKQVRKAVKSKWGKVERVFTIIFSLFISKWTYAVQLGGGRGGDCSVLKCIFFFWRLQKTSNLGFPVLNKNGCPLSLFLDDLSSSLRISQVGRSCTRVKS